MAQKNAGSGGSGLISILLIGAAGWWIYNNFFSSAAPAITSSETGPAPTPTSPAPVAPPEDLSKGGTKALMMNYITKVNPGIVPADGLFPYDNWNWIYKAVRGVDGPTWEQLQQSSFLGQKDRTYRMTFDEYWAAIQQGGLGQILDLSAFFSRTSLPSSKVKSMLRGSV